MTREMHVVLGAWICLIVAGVQARSQERWLEVANLWAAELQDQGRYKEAETVLSAALKEAENLPPGDPGIPFTLNNLASVYQVLGMITEAERCYRRAIARLGEIYGADFPKLTRPLQNLSSLYLEQGQYGEAEQLQRRLLALRPEASAPDRADSIVMSADDYSFVWIDSAKFYSQERLFG